MSLKIRLARARRQEAPLLPHRRRRRALAARRPLHREGRHLRPDEAEGRSRTASRSTSSKVKAWLAKGAQPTDRVLRFLDAAGLRSARRATTRRRPSPARRRRSAPPPRRRAAAAAAPPKATRRKADAAGAPALAFLRRAGRAEWGVLGPDSTSSRRPPPTLRRSSPEGEDKAPPCRQRPRPRRRVRRARMASAARCG